MLNQISFKEFREEVHFYFWYIIWHFRYPWLLRLTFESKIWYIGKKTHEVTEPIRRWIHDAKELNCKHNHRTFHKSTDIYGVRETRCGKCGRIRMTLIGD